MSHVSNVSLNLWAS